MDRVFVGRKRDNVELRADNGVSPEPNSFFATFDSVSQKLRKVEYG